MSSIYIILISSQTLLEGSQPHYCTSTLCSLAAQVTHYFNTNAISLTTKPTNRAVVSKYLKSTIQNLKKYPELTRGCPHSSGR
jgi:spore coat protein CotF